MAQACAAQRFKGVLASCFAAIVAFLTMFSQVNAASYIQDPEISWTVSVFNSPNSPQRFTREPVYLLNIGADRIAGWVAPRDAVNLENGTLLVPRGSEKPLATGGFIDGLSDGSRAGDRVEVYVLRRSQGSQTGTVLASADNLSSELQRYIAEGGIDDYRISTAIDTLLTRLARDDDDTLGGVLMKIRRLSAGQISVNWSTVGDSQLNGRPTRIANNKGRSSVSTQANFSVGQSIYPYQVRIKLLVASYRQAIGIDNQVEITAPLPQGNTPPAKAPIAQSVQDCSSGIAQVLSPKGGEIVRGIVPVIGSADCNGLRYYKFELENCGPGLCFLDGPKDCGADNICDARFGFTTPVRDGVLMHWDTTKIPNGRYTVRLTVVGRTNYVLPQQGRFEVTVAN